MHPHLMPVPDDGPFEYPIPKDERLDGQTFVKFWHHRWLASDLCLMASFEVKGMALDLFFLAQTQSPMGTLPVNRSLVARLLRVDAGHFEALCRHPFGPMDGWRPCVTPDGESRLYHPVVLEQVQDALARREAWLQEKSAAAVRERHRRLIAALHALGVAKAVTADKALVERMDLWLLDNWRGKRGAEAYHRVLAAAAEGRWFAAVSGGSVDLKR